MTIYGLKDLDHYTLREGDIVVFKFNNKQGEFVDLKYVVACNFLRAVQDIYDTSPSVMYGNDAIFIELGLDSYNFCSKCYGYDPMDGIWPRYKDYDFEAVTNVVKALYTLIDSMNGEWLRVKGDFCTFKRDSSIDMIWNGKEFGYKDINGEWKPASNCSITAPDSTPLKLKAQGTTSCRNPYHTSLLDMPIDKLKKIASQIKTIKEDNNSKLKRI